MLSTAPAAATGLPAFDRRRLLGSAALATIVAATATVPALAADHPDAELLRMVTDLHAAEALWKVMDNTAEEQQIFDRCEALSPPAPQALFFDETRDTFEICCDKNKISAEDIGGRWRRCYLMEKDIPTLRWKVAKWRQNGTGRNVVDRAEEIIAALDVYAPARKRAEDESGVTAFHEESRRNQALIDDLARRIAETPARTVEGVAAKARAAATRWSDDPTWIETDLLPDLLDGTTQLFDNRIEIILAISLIVDAMKLGQPLAVASGHRSAA